MEKLHGWHLVVSCEHASGRLPDGLDLGVSSSVLESHVAWDPGALPVAERVAQHFGAPLVSGQWSRIVADLNRSLDHPAVVPEVAFGVAIPGNTNLTPACRAQRIARYHAAYWSELERLVNEAMRVDPSWPVLHFSVHSLTPELHGQVRDKSIDIMLDPARPLERHIAVSMSSVLARSRFTVGQNTHYDGRANSIVSSFREKFPERRYAGIQVEINQRHLPELSEIADRLIAALNALRDHPFSSW